MSINRRDALKLGIAGAALPLVSSISCQKSNTRLRSSTSLLNMDCNPLRIPRVLTPIRYTNYDYYEITIKPGTVQLRDGTPTDIVGFEGEWPGPTIQAQRGRQVRVLMTNQTE